MLAIRCQFLNGTYQAAAPGRIGSAEWPPHPARLHTALVAAGWATGGERFPDAARAALRWLERQPSPSLAFGEAGHRDSPTMFVPRNLTTAEVGDVISAIRAGRDPSRQNGRVQRQFPTTIPGDAPAWFMWDSDEPTHVAALTTLAREVSYLGSSRSPVCCDVVTERAEIPEATIAPAGGAGVRALRVARAGFTDRLLGARETWPQPTHGAMLGYDSPTTADGLEPREDRPFNELVVHPFEPSFPLTLLHASLVTRALREAVLAHAGNDAPPIVHGHGRNPHIAFLALPNVGHNYSDGRILGVALAIPTDASDSEREAAITAVGKVETLRNLGIGSWRLLPARNLSTPMLSPTRWIGPARRWQTVTPVILDRHPKRRTDEALDVAIRATLSHAGVPSPRDIRCARVPWQTAALPAAAYRGSDLPNGLRLHLDLTFEHPVEGPLFAGRGRYFGVGLLKPQPERAAGSPSRVSRDDG
jgi:CRISPR-associated protein Csb2